MYVLLTFKYIEYILARYSPAAGTEWLSSAPDPYSAQPPRAAALPRPPAHRSYAAGSRSQTPAPRTPEHEQVK